MSALNQFHWPIQRVLRDWKDRRLDKPRNTLPIETTASALRYIRQMACHRAGVSDCACWSGEERITPIGEYPCAQCKQPGISMREISKSLFGAREDGEPNKEERVLRRAMQPDDFRKVLVNAWAHKWISTNQVMSLAYNTIQLEATSSVFRRFIKRLRERVSYRRTGIVTDDPKAVAAEVEAEISKLMDELTERGRERIKGSRAIDPKDKEWLLATNLPHVEE